MTKHQVLIKLGVRIRKLRIAKGFTQESFAEKAGLHRTYIGCVERGEKNITYITVLKIASALEINASDLLDVK